MATIAEIESMFADLRKNLDQPDQGKLIQMALFAAESVVVDIKRIANALDGGDPGLRRGINTALNEINEYGIEHYNPKGN